MTWYRFLLSIFAILLLVVPADAEEASVTEEVERRIEALVERVMTEVLEQIQSRFEPQQMTWLGKTIKMEFKLEPLEKGDKPHSISVATKTYAINAAITTKISSFSFNVQGNLSLMENKEQIGLTFRSNRQWMEKTPGTCRPVGAPSSTSAAPQPWPISAINRL